MSKPFHRIAAFYCKLNSFGFWTKRSNSFIYFEMNLVYPEASAFVYLHKPCFCLNSFHVSTNWTPHTGMWSKQAAAFIYWQHVAITIANIYSKASGNLLLTLSCHSPIFGATLVTACICMQTTQVNSINSKDYPYSYLGVNFISSYVTFHASPQIWKDPSQ